MAVEKLSYNQQILLMPWPFETYGNYSKLGCNREYFFDYPHLLPGEIQDEGAQKSYRENEMVESRLKFIKMTMQDLKFESKQMIDFSCSFVQNNIVFTGSEDHWFFKLLNNNKDIRNIADDSHDGHHFAQRLLGQRYVNPLVLAHKMIVIELTEQNWRILVDFLMSRECAAAFSQHQDEEARCNDDFLELERDFKGQLTEIDEKFLHYQKIESKVPSHSARQDQVVLDEVIVDNRRLGGESDDHFSDG